MTTILLAPALCQASIPSAVLFQSTAPIRIDQCVADVRDSSVGNVRYYFETAVDFTNTSSKTVTAVRFRFTTFNAFHEPLRSYTGTSSDLSAAPGSQQIGLRPSKEVAALVQRAQAIGMAPPPADLVNAMYDPDYRFINLDDTTAAAVCSIDSVLFSDGTIWRSPSYASAVLERTAQRARRPSPDVVLETQDE